MEIKLNDIEVDIFETKKSTKNQERTRRIIEDKIEIAMKNPEQYERFTWFIPNNMCKKHYTILEMSQFAKTLGGRIASDVEVGLIWATMITKGILSWEELCDMPDISRKFRIFKAERGYKMLGGSKSNGYYSVSRSEIHKGLYEEDDIFFDALPIIVIPISN